MLGPLSDGPAFLSLSILFKTLGLQLHLPSGPSCLEDCFKGTVT